MSANAINWTHNFKIGDFVTLKGNSYTFTCTMDGNTAQKLIPRTTDPSYNKRLAITAVTTNTFTVNVGKSQGLHVHTFVSAPADAICRQNTRW